MDNILIVSNTASTMSLLSDFLRTETFNRIVASQNGAEARRYVTEMDFDFIVIDSPLGDENGIDLAITAAEKTTAGIMLIVKESDAFEISSRVEDYGVFVMPKPSTPSFFYQAAKLLSASRMRVRKLEDENQKLLKKIEEIRLVDRAKLVLIQVLKMTEPQAQRYIEKQSMDLRQSRVTTAKAVLRTYES